MLSSGQIQVTVTNSSGQRTESFERTEIVVGRSTSADLVINNAEVSRRHAIIKIENGQMFITDLGSKNGTFVNNRPIPPHTQIPLRSGEKLRMGLAPDQLTLKWQPPIQAAIEPPSPKVQAPPPPRQISPSTRIARILEDPPSSPPPLNSEMAGTSSELKLEKTSKSPESLLGSKVQAISEPKSSEMPNLSKEQGLLEIAIKTLNLEKAKLEGELSELRQDVAKRSGERMEMARLHADGKLRLQNLQGEVARLEKAKDQLQKDLGEEVADLDEKALKLSQVIEQESKEHREKIQRNIKEQIGKAKKHAEMLVAEAEIKVKAIREKSQAEVADLKKTAELDLAEMKLKQMQEGKSVAEKEELRLHERREKAANEFLRELRVVLGQGVYSQNIDPSFKVKILSLLEEVLFKHFAPEKIMVFENPIPTGGGQPLVDSEAETRPPPSPKFFKSRFPIMVVSASLALVIGLVLGRNYPNKSGSAELASLWSDNGWKQWVVRRGEGEIKAWQGWSGQYLRDSIKIDSRDLMAYQAMESQFMAQMRETRDSDLASAKFAKFSKEASQQLGEANWELLKSLRRQFNSKNP